MIAFMNFNTVLNAIRKIIPKMRTLYFLVILGCFLWYFYIFL